MSPKKSALLFLAYPLMCHPPKEKPIIRFTPPPQGATTSPKPKSADIEVADPKAESSSYSCQPQNGGGITFERLYFEPAQPKEGETVTILAVAKSEFKDKNQVKLNVNHYQQRELTHPHLVNGKRSMYFFSYGPLKAGDVCLALMVNGQVDLASKITVPKNANTTKIKGAFALSLHQRTCAEQPTWGNEVHIKVVDQSGSPMINVPVRIAYSDFKQTVDPGRMSAKSDSIENKLQNNQSALFFTDGSGKIDTYIYAPITTRTENGDEVSFMNFYKIWVDNGQASDIGQRITTGWWPDQPNCPEKNANVWGHWSYDLLFRFNEAATSYCKVNDDHAGMPGLGLIMEDSQNLPECFTTR